MSFDQSLSAWISRGFEQLVAQDAAGTLPVFDVLIVGSGYGGAIAADIFSNCTVGGAAVNVCVLERGREYLPGAFPRGFRELPGHLRMESNKEGLFDIRGGSDVNTVVANGLGGGSLINAGVMEEPGEEVFTGSWPSQLTYAALKPFYDRSRVLLGAWRNGAANNIELLPVAEQPQKYAAIRSLANGVGAPFRPAAITVAMSDVASSGNVELKKCNRCGDCATGCNFGAKDSLDVNLLARAFKSGAQIYTGATVLDIERDGGGNLWIVNTVHTDTKLRKRQGARTAIRAKNVVLAAGALGSTEILMRSQSNTLRFSGRLGRRCSTNGDMLVTDYDTNAVVNTIANERVAPSGRAVGPTITGIVDLRDAQGVLIEEMSVPAGLRGAFTEIFGTVNLLHKLAVPDKEKHERGHPADDIYEVDGQRIDRSALYAVMGDDGAIGSIGLFREGESVSVSQLTDDDDGVGRIDWPGASNIPLFDHQVAQVTSLAKESKGTILPNPVWKLLPPDMTWLLDDLRGPVTTVHPLGGCAMGNTMASGVVDDIGRVFDAATPETVHSGLVVLDGSIVPTALGTNPALTIAAVSLRAAELLAAEWGYTHTAPSLSGAADKRPVFRNTDLAFDPEPTQVEIIERLAGPVKFKDADGRRTTRIVELTLRFDEHEIAALTRPNEYGAGATLNVSTDASEAPKSSRIRIYEQQDWDDLNLKYVPPYRLEKKLDEIAVFAAPVTGTMNVFLREKSRRLGRTARAFAAYLANRGGRDAWQALGESDGGPNPCSRLKSGLALASRSGEIRLLEYVLDVGTPTKTDISLSGSTIVGRKEFTYRRKSNPWRQLMDVALDEFPGLRRRERRRVLRLDPVHLTRIGVPLFHVTRQADGATAIADLIAFFGYFIRLLVGLHIWSFRQPDAETGTKTIDRFPSRAVNMPIPQIFPVDLGSEVPAGSDAPVPGEMRLTRFPGTDPSKHPVLLIPGYSTSGTAFSHRALYPNFASHLWDSGRDVWILDMRSSSAFEATAKKPWSFEQIAHRDLTVALHYVYDKTGKSVDIHAHCMGAAMLSMALLRPTPVPGFPHVDTTKMPEWIHRVSLSQVGPLVVMSPANIFRSYAFRYFLQYLPDADYQFRPEEPTLADDLLDRILSTLPYPEAEFTITNPLKPWKRTEWTRTRHRMDALYGRSFNLVNVGEEVLDHIDDQFGPLSLRTVTQAIHFARYSIITDVHGRNTFVSRDGLEGYWKGNSFGESIRKLATLSLHGPENGLADIRTLDRIDAVMVDAGMTYASRPVGVADGAGHQDALIGHEKLRKETFEAVREFFDTDLLENPNGPSEEQVAYPPWIGPIVTEEIISPLLYPRTTIRIGTRPTHRTPECAVMLPVEVHDGRLTRVGGDDFIDNDQSSEDYIIDNLVVYTSTELQDEFWDAFLRPEFPKLNAAMPYDGAILVLVIYNETPQLGSQGKAWFGLDFGDPQHPVLRPITEGRWIMDSSSSPPTLPDDEFPARLLVTVFSELLNQPGAAGGSQPAGAGLPTATLFSGQAEADARAAVIGRLLDEDYDLTDGVFTHRAPEPPKAEPAPGGTAFVLGSCQYPRGFIDEPVAYEAWGHLLERIDGVSLFPAPQFGLLCGDQVYVDATAGLFDPTMNDDTFELPYHRWLRNDRVRDVLRKMPSFMLLDDHEIEDNWEPIAPPSPDNSDLRDAGVEGYRKYQRGMTAPPSPPGQSDIFRIEGVPLFILDTRSTRERRTAANLDAATLFDAQTLNDLGNWLAGEPAIPKFVVSPSMLLPRHRRATQWNEVAAAVRSDGWDGYPATLHAVLSRIVDDGNVQHVVFLSGDEHCGSVATIDITNVGSGATKRIHSIHTCGTFTPYPFANGSPSELMGSETFAFQHGGSAYRCVVSTAFAATRNRFTYLNLRKDGADWLLEHQFGDGPVGTLVV